MAPVKHFFWKSWRLAALLALTAVGAQAHTLYSTDFEEFSGGDDKWVGTNGWLGNSVGVGVHGIDTNLLPGLGKTAFLGSARPKSTFVAVFRPILYDPVTNGTPIVEFETLMGIQDSTNGHRDSFFFTFYNGSGNLLASIRFDNSDLSYGIWRLDGTNQVDTGVDFIRSELNLLFATVDYSNNVWSADLNGIPLFTGALFNATARPRNLGYIAAEWQLAGSTTNDFGNNWMLVADWAVRTFPISNVPFWVESTGSATDAFPFVKWTGTPGFDYRIEHSQNMTNWQSGLSNSVFTNIQATTPLTFTDESPATQRYFRVRRSFAP
jgi:hypothetical protein